LKPVTGPRRQTGSGGFDFGAHLELQLPGQPDAVRKISSFVEVYNAGLAPQGRPAGVFLLLGPTGTGKTRTVETVAGILHGDSRQLIKVDCGEYQTEHEVARLIGAPPGYLGHRETPPVFTQQRLASVSTQGCGLSIILFDEIEKAAPAVTRVLLGVLDRAILHLGDNTQVNFENTLIFLTSNLGARAMQQEMNPGYGFGRPRPGDVTERSRKLEAIALSAVRKRFSPEFVNRLDSVITYQPLRRTALEGILDQLIVEVQEHIDSRLKTRGFCLDIPARTRSFLLAKGSSDEYGARELRRTLHRHVVQPMAAMLVSEEVRPGSVVRARVKRGRVILERGLHVVAR